MVAPDVYACAKILIFQQITTITKTEKIIVRCLCLCKDTNFSANHNSSLPVRRALLDVYACAKILIFQQITTGDKQGLYNRQMFMLVQRY